MKLKLSRLSSSFFYYLNPTGLKVFFFFTDRSHDHSLVEIAVRVRMAKREIIGLVLRSLPTCCNLLPDPNFKIKRKKLKI